MNPWFRSSLMTASALCVAMAHGTAWASDASERERISKAKSQADTKLAQKELECQERFAVTDCVLLLVWPMVSVTVSVTEYVPAEA